MKLKDIVFFGFTQKELAAIRKATGEDEDQEYTISLAQEIADVVGSDVATLILPGCNLALVKMGEAAAV